MMKKSPRVLIVAEHASGKFGGEAMLPLHYFRVLEARGLPVWMIVHARSQPELEQLFPRAHSRIRFVPDTPLHRGLWRAGRHLPQRLDVATFNYASHVLTQCIAREYAGELVRDEQIDVVHQPIPVSPKEPSVLHDLGVPVVIGPMNGGMSYPLAFESLEGAVNRAAMRLGRRAADQLNRLLPGKRRAEVLVVANQRTRRALPTGTTGSIVELAENGVDLGLWPGQPAAPDTHRVPRFIFVGRLVPFKGVDWLLHAFRRVVDRHEAELRIVGDGPVRGELDQLTRALGLEHRVHFTGWLSQAEVAEQLRHSEVLVLPSLMECGGAVVLEAMASAVPVVATAWGGPRDYLDRSCGFLVAPIDRELLIEGFAEAMSTLAASPELRTRMGLAGRRRVIAHFDWEKKVDRMLEIYDEAIDRWRVERAA
jgi:glycosyltransferase involved in cell wall biosynthesis